MRFKSVMFNIGPSQTNYFKMYTRHHLAWRSALNRILQGAVEWGRQIVCEWNFPCLVIKCDNINQKNNTIYKPKLYTRFNITVWNCMVFEECFIEPLTGELSSLARLVGYWGFISLQHLGSYQDDAEHSYDDFIVLPHWVTRHHDLLSHSVTLSWHWVNPS